MKSNIVDLKTRVASVRETGQITKALQLISASKLNKITKKYNNNIFYYNKVFETIGEILRDTGEVRHKYFYDHKLNHTTYIVIASDMGLAGEYNARILNYALNIINQNPNQKTIYVVGYMAQEFFDKHSIATNADYIYFSQDPTLDDALSLSSAVIDLYDTKQTNEIVVVYTESSGTNFIPKQLKLLPISPQTFLQDTTVSGYDLVFEPSKKEVFDILVPQFVTGEIYSALIQAVKCEQFERMITMNEATKNTTKMLDSLKMDYNNLRQASITKEVTEISSAIINKE